MIVGLIPNFTKIWCTRFFLLSGSGGTSINVFFPILYFFIFLFMYLFIYLFIYFIFKTLKKWISFDHFVVQEKDNFSWFHLQIGGGGQDKNWRGLMPNMPQVVLSPRTGETKMRVHHLWPQSTVKKDSITCILCDLLCRNREQLTSEIRLILDLVQTNSVGYYGQ